MTADWKSYEPSLVIVDSQSHGYEALLAATDSSGWSVHLFRNGRSALRHPLLLRASVILLSSELADLDPLELAASVRSAGGKARMCVVASGSDPELEQSLRGSNISLTAKPVDPAWAQMTAAHVEGGPAIPQPHYRPASKKSPQG